MYVSRSSSIENVLDFFANIASVYAVNAVYEFHCWIWSMGRDNRPWNECEYYDICEGIVQRNKRDVDDECKRIGRYQGSIKGGLNDVKNTLTSVSNLS